jgi:hypothetical protein
MQSEGPPFRLCQNDFDVLAVLDLQQDGICTLSPVFNEVLSGCSSEKTEDCAITDYGHYVPRNFISKEVYQLLAAYERTSAVQREAVADGGDAMDLDMSPHEAYIQLGPTRPLTPPKRYSRTFWRSAAWRLLQKEKKAGFIEIRRCLTTLSNQGML